MPIDSSVLSRTKLRVLRPRLVISDVTGSTNEDAKVLATRGAGEGLIVVAGAQTHGRGRLDRAWSSPPGGFYMSIALRPRLGIRNAPLLGLLCGCAVVKALRSRLDVLLKWPNDIMYQEKKLGGILSEYLGEVINLAIVGIGINANFTTDALPSPIRECSTAILDELGKEISLDQLFREIVKRVDAFLWNVDRAGSFEPVIEEWKRLNCTLGRRVRVNTSEGVIEGVARGIGGDGSLHVATDDGEGITVREGDVVLLRDII
ncbi:MAG: biotin--[acetyl-CoA-carboxylase] ligase [Candidatus Thorarchaeota archaeon]